MNKRVRYDTVLFDLFDTIILFEPSLLPSVTTSGKKIYSTAENVFSVFRNYFPHTGFDTFYKHFRRSYTEFQNLKNKENREYNNIIRFDIMFRNMGIREDRAGRDIKLKLVEAHMRCLEKSMVLPCGHSQLLQKLKTKGYNMSVVSNFDYAPTAHKLLNKFGISLYFSGIYISDEIGWRKPDSRIFSYALEDLGVSKSEVIFVGDDYIADITGASALGIDTVYVNRSGYPEDCLCTYRIEDLCQLDQIF